MNLTLLQAVELLARDLATLPGETLFHLHAEAVNGLTQAKAHLARLEQALTLKYAEEAQTLRHAQGKDTGVVHFSDGALRITADLPKKVEWDQKQLSEIVQRIADSGENPGDYVEITYRVPESRFSAWPETLKSAFASARTLKTGKPDFRLALLQANAEGA